MKVITMIVLSIFLTKACSQAGKNDLSQATIQYNASARGFYQQISIKNQTLTVSKDRNGKDVGQTKIISDADWNELVGYFKTVNLDSLPTYKDPTQKRFYDGAPIANMTVTYKNKAYSTVSFDHGFPPVAIEKLVTKVVSLAQTEHED